MRHLSELKDSQLGNACIILGNGPSLTLELLDVFRHLKIFSFVANGFCLIFDKTEFRPDAVCMSNMDAVSRFGASYPQSALKFYVEGAGVQLGSGLRNLFELPFACKHDQGLHTSPFIGDGNFSLDPSIVNYCGDTVVLDFALPIAFFMGFTEVFLCGVDCDYSKGYFCHGYEKNASPGFKGMIHGDYSIAIPAYEYTEKIFRQNGRRLARLTQSDKLSFIKYCEIEELIGRFSCLQQ